ncbi:hypothetical protein PMAYCL1PPCAC_09189, partial [Pristionchus mayeri]
SSTSDTLALPLVLLGCTLAIVSSLFSAVHILVEINQFQDDAFRDMDEFRTLSNNAWGEMILATRQPTPDSPPPHSRSSRSATRSYGAPSVAPFYYVENTRFSRQNGDNMDDPFFPAPVAFSSDRPACSKCSHQARQNLCEAGPRGPPGEPGEIGFDGLPGRDGLDGLAWMAAMAADLPCTRCPQGPPGEEGPPGFAGNRGPPGEEGIPGRRGADGRPGFTGPSGPVGSPGQDGAPGNRGRNGLPSIRYKGLPGGPGPRGVQGESGPNGLPGMPGPRGLPGDAGVDGPAGRNGTSGADGAPGASGARGLPGRDAIYCPCPARGLVVEPPQLREPEDTVAPETTVDAVDESQPHDDEGEFATRDYGIEPTTLPELTTTDNDQTQVNASQRLVEEYRTKFRGLLRRWRTRRRLLKLRQAAVV